MESLSAEELGTEVGKLGPAYASVKQEIIESGVTGEYLHSKVQGNEIDFKEFITNNFGVTKPLQQNVLFSNYEKMLRSEGARSVGGTATTVGATSTFKSSTGRFVGGRDSSASALPLIPFEELEVDKSKEPFLGSGSFGDVYRGWWKKSELLKRDVAIKVTWKKPGTDFASKKRDAREEADLVYDLSEKHRDLIEFITVVYGCAEGPVPATLSRPFHIAEGDECFCIVMGLAAGGTLYNVLHGVPLRPLSTHDKLNLLVRIARAIAELHAVGLIHGDLKPENILLGDEKLTSVKVADFGMSKMRANHTKSDLGKSTVQLTDTIQGTPKYCSPEMLKSSEASGGGGSGVASASRSTDMYAFAVIAWEVLSREKPFEGFKSIDSLAAAVSKGTRPPLDKLPADTPDAVRTMIQRCWHADRARRLHAHNCWELIASELPYFEQPHQRQGGTRPGSAATEPLSRSMLGSLYQKGNAAKPKQSGKEEEMESVVKLAVKINDVEEFRQAGHEALKQQGQRHNREDDAYFAAKAAMFSAESSDPLDQALSTTEAALDRVAAKVMMARHEQRARFVHGIERLDHELRSTLARVLDETKIADIVNRHLAGMDAVVRRQLKESMSEVMRVGHASLDTKLQRLKGMIENTIAQIKDAQASFDTLPELQRTAAAANEEKVVMPRTFILLPFQREPVPMASSPSSPTSALSPTGVKAWAAAKLDQVVGGAMRAVKSTFSTATRLCWTTLRVQFVCPVTLQPAPEVEGGPCVITLPSEKLVVAAKALKYGAAVLKIVLATQGLGNVVPDLSALVPDANAFNAFMDEFEHKIQEADAAAAAWGGPLAGAMLTDVGDAATAGANAGLDKLRSEFQTIFDDAAESDGTTSMLAIYGLIAKEKKGFTLEQALKNNWKPRDKKKRPWGMVLVQPKGSNQWVWASEEGARRLQAVGLDALNPAADVNRDAVKTGKTMTEVVASTGGMVAKQAGIDVDGIKQRCAEKYGIRAGAVVAVLESPAVIQVLLSLSSLSLSLPLSLSSLSH